ncbi:NAD(P)/FAD-dependent oxidoreductase [Haloglycomyces albus]|uniref:NAD(P)/FAD-dependent oxidoreductase n=1 Tax=Haloglycomyces albus TaxID=526067 RepID=UPI00046D7455|nr:FAD-dependent oxidoreductase [Haloglycomyces albus]
MTTRIIILGAGYAGLLAANGLAARLRPEAAQIHLVDAEETFCERIRMHQLAAGQAVKSVPIDRLVPKKRVRCHTAWVSSVDPEQKQVVVRKGNRTEHLDYDILIVALGSGSAGSLVPGVDEYAYHLSHTAEASALDRRLRQLGSSDRVTVVGGGMTGIEMASELAESYPRLPVTLMSAGQVGQWLPDRSRRYIVRSLSDLGVVVREDTEVKKVDANGLHVSDADYVDSDVTVWTGGFQPACLTGTEALESNDCGQIIVDEGMRSVSHSDVYAIGDIASVPGPNGTAMRMSCAVGVLSGWRSAQAIAARLSGRPMRKTPLKFVGQNISLGRKNGLVQFVTPDDEPKKAHLTGRKAAWVKEFVSRGAMLTPHLIRRFQRRRPTDLSVGLAAHNGARWNT